MSEIEIIWNYTVSKILIIQYLLLYYHNCISAYRKYLYIYTYTIYTYIHIHIYICKSISWNCDFFTVGRTGSSDAGWCGDCHGEATERLRHPFLNGSRSGNWSNTGVKIRSNCKSLGICIYIYIYIYGGSIYIYITTVWKCGIYHQQRIILFGK